jgi:hypothetical protein
MVSKADTDKQIRLYFVNCKNTNFKLIISKNKHNNKKRKNVQKVDKKEYITLMIIMVDFF